MRIVLSSVQQSIAGVQQFKADSGITAP